MTDAFLSHVDEDREIAELIAAELEARGCRVWFYERDSIPGLSYLLQTREAIDRARSFLFLISPAALKRHTQIEKELVHAHEIDKPIIPILCDVQFREFRQSRPSWHQAIGANVGIEVTMQNVRASIPRLFSGLVALGIGKLNETKSPVDSAESGVSVDADLDVNLSENDEFAEDIELSVAEVDESGEEIADQSTLVSFVHEHPTTGFLADAIFTQRNAELDEPLSIAFSHALLKPDPFIVEFRSKANCDPIQYFRFPELIHGYPVILRAYWLNRLPEVSMFQKTFGAAFAPPIRVQQKQSILVNEDEVGIIVQGEFRSIIPAGESLPRIQKRRFRTARTNQKAISITPAVRRFNGQIQQFSAMRLSVPLATKGVAWLEFTFRIDPDGRLTLIARDPLHRMKIRDIFVVQ